MKYQLCPKCNGDGHLGRYNSPAIASSNSLPQCDVCYGAKTLLVRDDQFNQFNFPKTDSEIKAYGLLLKICRLENLGPSPYGPENEALKIVIEKLKAEYYQLVSEPSPDIKNELEKFFDWYKKANVYLGTWTPTAVTVKNICRFHSCTAEALPGKAGCIEHNSLIV